MLDEVIEKLENLCGQAARACCSSKPTGGDDPAYYFGRLQGKFAGLTEALKMVCEMKELQESDFDSDSDETEEGVG